MATSRLVPPYKQQILDNFVFQPIGGSCMLQKLNCVRNSLLVEGGWFAFAESESEAVTQGVARGLGELDGT